MMQRLPREIQNLVISKMPIAEKVKFIKQDKKVLDTYILTYVKLFRKLLEMIHNVTMIKYYTTQLDKTHKMDMKCARLPDNKIQMIVSEYKGNDKFFISLAPGIDDEEEPIVRMDVTDLSTREKFVCELGNIHAIARNNHSKRIDEFTIKGYTKSIPEVIKFLVAFSKYQPVGEDDDTIIDVNELDDVDRLFFLKYKDYFHNVTRPTMFIDWKREASLSYEVNFALFVRKLLRIKPHFRLYPSSEENKSYVKLVEHYLLQLEANV
jgi:hypothetical protein